MTTAPGHDIANPLAPGSTVLVTGAAGFIGSHIAQRLAAEGFGVVGVDNFSDFYSRRWKEANVAAISPAVRVEEIDILDESGIARLLATVRPTAIVHLASMAGVRPSIEQPALYARVNVEGTTQLLEAARQSGVARFLFASSSSVYGNNAKVPFQEDDDVSRPISPYAATKRAGELVCHAFHHLHHLPIACVRLFTVYGPRQRPDLAIQKFARLIDRGLPIPFYGDGTSSRDYTYVDDVVAGLISALQRIPQAGCRIYNIGGSHPVALAELVKAMESALGKMAILDRRPAQPGDVERTYADISRARRELCWEPATSLQDGLARFVQWLRASRELYPDSA